jgi:HK97 family phage prohead protease
MKLERRSFDVAVGLDGGKLVGRAASYGVRSHDLGGFIEVLEPGCFERSLTERPSGMPDVCAYYDHEPGNLLGRTSSGTLRLWTSEAGLEFELDLPDTQLGRDVRELVGRGDLKGCSFGMIINDQDWHLGEGLPLRRILDVDLIEVSIVATPAYPETELALRALAEVLDAQARAADEAAEGEALAKAIRIGEALDYIRGEARREKAEALKEIYRETL